MRKLFILLTIFIFCTPNHVFGADESADIKKFSEKEYKVAVQKEVARQLTRLGKIKIVGLSKELMNKEDKIKIRELEVQKQEEQLKINMQQFEKRIKKLQIKQSKFIGCLDGIESKRQKRVGHMVSVVSGMRPQNAANLLSVQDSEISIKLLSSLIF